jgi:hypothetical protein
MSQWPVFYIAAAIRADFFARPNAVCPPKSASLHRRLVACLRQGGHPLYHQKRNLLQAKGAIE